MNFETLEPRDLLTCLTPNEGCPPTVLRQPGFSGSWEFVADVDGDGVTDVRQHENNDLRSDSFYSLASGVLKPIQVVPAFQVLEGGDINGDGFNDVVISGGFVALDNNYSLASTTSFLLSDGARIALPQQQSIDSPFIGPYDIAGPESEIGVLFVEDVSGDGITDIAYADWHDNIIGYGALSVDGRLNAAAIDHYFHEDELILSGEAGTSLADNSDVDGDGIDDIVVPTGTLSVKVWVSNQRDREEPIGRFTEHKVPGFMVNLHSIGDRTGDGIDDLVARFPASGCCAGVSGSLSLLSADVDLLDEGEVLVAPEGVGNLSYTSPNDDFLDVNGDGLEDHIVMQDWDDWRLLIAEHRDSADFNDDGQVNFADFLILSDNFGKTNAPGDANNDHVVDFTDFLVLSQQFGTTLE